MQQECDAWDSCCLDYQYHKIKVMKVLALVSNHFVSVLQQRPGIVINQNFGFARGWIFVMIICKRLDPLDDHLQEAGSSG